MTVSSKIKSYLEDEGVDYQTLEHPKEVSALKVAGAQHIPGKEFLKTVMIEADGEVVMCVLPSIYNIDFEKLSKSLQATELKLLEEEKMGELFPDYEIGAEPPFGHLYNLKVYLDKTVEEDEVIAFNAGTHTDVIKIDYQDYKRLVNPIVEDFGKHI